MLCNVAGIGGFRLDHEQTLEDRDRIFGVNLTGTRLVTQAALPALLASKRAIADTASTAATDATPYSSAYAASKGSVVALTRSLAVIHAKAEAQSATRALEHGRVLRSRDNGASPQPKRSSSRGSAGAHRHFVHLFTHIKRQATEILSVFRSGV